MKFRKFKGAHLLIAATVAALVVMPIAFANASGPGAAKSAVKQVKALTKRVNALEAALNGRIAALEAKKDPTTLPPSGPAGGSLTGNYPNPLIGADKVGAPEIAANAVGSSEIADGAVGAGELGVLSVGGAAFKPATPIVSAGVEVKAGETKLVKVSCPGATRLIAGGAEWGSANSNGASLISSGPTFEQGDPNTTWTVQGRVDTGGATNTIFAEALCLAA